MYSRVQKYRRRCPKWRREKEDNKNLGPVTVGVKAGVYTLS